ncbi:MAG: alpha/beta hydrolase fold domain-containing protein [Phycisphaerae bacterium]
MTTRSRGLAAVMICGVALPAGAQITPTLNDVKYATVLRDDGVAMPVFLDLYAPSTPGGPAPLLIWVHGGGWQGGTHNNVPSAALALRSNGFAIASVEYRLSGEAIFPAQIHDVKGAVRFLRANAATFNLDPDRFGAWGSSAGGHLVALLGTSGGVAAAEGATGGNTGVSSRVQVVVDYFGPTDLLRMNLDVTTPPGSTIDHDSPASPESHLIGFDDPGQGVGVLRANQSNPNPPFPQLIALITLANPVAHAGAGDPPTFIAHGEIDTLVPIRQSERLFDALAAAGVEAPFVRVPGAGHGGLGASTDAAAQLFIRKHLSRAGDMNCDGRIDNFDVDPFVLALVQPAAYAASQPNCRRRNADVNQDGAVDNFDIDAFVAVLVE